MEMQSGTTTGKKSLAVSYLPYSQQRHVIHMIKL